MGIYLNPTSALFQRILNSEVYVDKTLLISTINKSIDTEQCYICISRPRRFGKSVDASMLVAYYSKGCESQTIFDGLKIGQCESYKKHLNQYNVIHLDMQQFLSSSKSIEEMIESVTVELSDELKEAFPNGKIKKNLAFTLRNIYAQNNHKFIFIVDEWDCVLRDAKVTKDEQIAYLDFLRLLFKGQPYVSLVYMTGILPIKKYGTHSALNMFDEISMINATPYEPFMGFTEQEVQHLCEQYNVDFDTVKNWYDGYHLDDYSLYSPKSVISAITKRKIDSYWSQTETYEALKTYININYDGLKEDIVQMLAGKHVSVRTSAFQNDMQTFNSKHDILTLLIHLGYLGFDFYNKEAYIPNKEVMNIFMEAILDSNWKDVVDIITNSDQLLKDTWNLEEERVAQAIEKVHYETSILQYNDENALSYVVSLAYIAARKYYTIIREMPSGKGYADLVFIPIQNKPAMIIELKYNQEVEGAISQIKSKNYMHGLEKYKDNLILIGINDDLKTKKHQCGIEKLQ